jgi:hypothetical protein
MPSRKQFSDVHGAAILDELSPGGRWDFLRGKVNGTTWKITFPGGSTLTPFPASDYNSQTARGIRADIVVVDECDDVGTDVYNAVAGPWLSGTWSLREELLAGTPTRGRHGLWWRMLEMGRRGASIRKGELEEDDAETGLALSSIYASHSTYRDSPEIVNAATVAKQKATTPKATFEREWEANPDAGEGLIYPGFDEEFHVRQPPDRSEFDEFHAGMDFGSANPGALIECGIRGKDRDAELWILREWYDVELPNQVWDERAKALRHCKFWPDSSRADRVTDLRSFGLNVGETDRGPGSVAAGIARLADLIHIRQREYTGPAYEPIVQRYARMYVAPGCTNVRRELGLYRRKKYPDGTFSDEPEKKNDHAMDGIRYVALGVFGRMPNRRHEESR